MEAAGDPQLSYTEDQTELTLGLGTQGWDWDWDWEISGGLIY